MSTAVVCSLGAMALASIVEVVALGVMSVRVLKSGRALARRGTQMAADVAIVRRDLTTAARGFQAAAASGCAAAARAEDVARFGRRVGGLVALAARLRFGGAAALWSAASMLRQRG